MDLFLTCGVNQCLLGLQRVVEDFQCIIDHITLIFIDEPGTTGLNGVHEGLVICPKAWPTKDFKNLSLRRTVKEENTN
jgi:hypothetical protein